jgi:hypothetical protein
MSDINTVYVWTQRYLADNVKYAPRNVIEVSISLFAYLIKTLIALCNSLLLYLPDFWPLIEVFRDVEVTDPHKVCHSKIIWFSQRVSYWNPSLKDCCNVTPEQKLRGFIRECWMPKLNEKLKISFSSGCYIIFLALYIGSSLNSMILDSLLTRWASLFCT